MIGPQAQQKYFLYAQATDMRKSFDGLCGLVRNGLRRNPTGGEVYIFLNRKRDMVKLLFWDRSGFVVYCKRLERGTFERPLRGKHQTNPILPTFFDLATFVAKMPWEEGNTALRSARRY